MQSSSNIIKKYHNDETKSFSDMSLPEFHKPVSTQESADFSLANLPEFMPSVSNSSEQMTKTLSDSSYGSVGHHNIHSAVLRNGQVHSLINGWSAPVLQGIITHRVKAVLSANTEDMTRQMALTKDQFTEIIAKANEKAAQILIEAEKEAEKLKQKAFMEGMNAAKSETAQSMHQVERIFQETQLWQEQVMRQSQGRMMEMIVEIGRKIFGGGFELPAEQIDHIVSRAISEGSRLGDLRIYLHPEDSKILVNLWQESEITVNGQRIQIVSSQNISRGGCFVDGQFGIVDGRVEEQLDQIVETLKPVLTNLQLEEV